MGALDTCHGIVLQGSLVKSVLRGLLHVREEEGKEGKGKGEERILKSLQQRRISMQVSMTTSRSRFWYQLN